MGYDLAGYKGQAAAIEVGAQEAEYADCRRCGKTVNARALVNGLCHACRVETAQPTHTPRPGRETATRATLKHCKQCGKELGPGRSKYCSKSCYNEGRRLEARRQRGAHEHCVICGKALPKGRGVCCSSKCLKEQCKKTARQRYRMKRIRENAAMRA